MPATDVQLTGLPLTRLNPWMPGQYGVPGAWTDTGLRHSPEGTVFYVDPNHHDANDGRDGTDPTAPLATVARAITLCESYKGDVVWVAANNVFGTVYDTPITESVVVDKAGIKLVGVTDSPMGVYWQPSTDEGTCIVVGAPDVVIEGFAFHVASHGTTNIVDVGVDIQYDGANSRWGYQDVVRHCTFTSAITAGIQIRDIDGGPSTGNYFHDNEFLGCAYGIYGLEPVLNCSIYRNRFHTCTNAVWMTAALCTVHDNWFQQENMIGDDYLILGGRTGAGGANVVTGNYFGCVLGGGPGSYNDTCEAGDGLNIVGGSTDHWVQNYCWDGPTVDNP